MQTSRSPKPTPVMQQYYRIKATYKDAILLFRIGDFYETFESDAKQISQLLDITLTRRANGAASEVALAGFPHHAYDNYVPKLVQSGCRVAICEQMEDPKQAKGIVKREVIRLLTPGLSGASETRVQNHMLGSLYAGKKQLGLALLDMSTGEFFVHEGDLKATKTLLNAYAPAEILYCRLQKSVLQEMALLNPRTATHAQEDWVYSESSAQERLLRHFGTHTLKGFAIDTPAHSTIAAGAIMQYLDYTKHIHTQHIVKIQRIHSSRHMWMDDFTVRNLELTEPLRSRGTSLFDTLNDTQTAMGGRCLRRWVLHPLKDIGAITERQKVVDILLKQPESLGTIRTLLKELGDMQKRIGKMAQRRILPRELLKIAQNLLTIQQINTCISAMKPPLKGRFQQIAACEKLMEILVHRLLEDPAPKPSQGAVFHPRAYEKLGKLRRFIAQQRKELLNIQILEAKRTGISSLKIGYNKIFGYYLEVRNTHKNRVPTQWIRKQTLVGAERYITQDLKGYEERILTAEEELVGMEEALYEKLLDDVLTYVPALHETADILSQLDVLSSWAWIAERRNYVCPQLSEQRLLDLRKARHPVIESQMKKGEVYVANDVYMSVDTQQVMVVTGPNMSGKSALLRMSALVVLMAQMGCYVPATEAKIGVIDSLFTRVGASDNVSQGESTFMVEMNETASILNNLGERCLILMDEVGRGTSTYDGISIAWAIVEHVHQKTKACMLFATHYHELSLMATGLSRVKNYHIKIKEHRQSIIFLYQLAGGCSHHSFGLHVAKISGLPASIITRAEEVLLWLEKTHSRQGLQKRLKEHLTHTQIGLFEKEA